MTKRSLLLFWVMIATYCLNFAAQHYYVPEATSLTALVEFKSITPVCIPRVLSFALCHAFARLVAPLGCSQPGAMHVFFVGWETLCLLGASIFMFQTVQAEFRKPWLSCATLVLFLANLTAIFQLPRMGNWFYPYDVAAVFFLSFILYLTVTRKPLWSIALVLAVAVINRESILFAIPMFVLLRWRVGTKPGCVLLEATALLIVWVAAKCSVQYAMGGVGNHVVLVRDETGMLRAVRNVLIFLTRPMMLVKFMVSVGFVWLFAFWSACTVPHRLARCAWAILPVAGLMGLVGNYDEVRVFGETAVFASVACAALLEQNIRRIAPQWPR